MLISKTWYEKCLTKLIEQVNPIVRGNIRMVAYELFSYDEKKWI